MARRVPQEPTSRGKITPGLQEEVSGHSDCADACFDCYRTCMQTMVYCTQQGGKHSDPQHLALLADCAAMCLATAQAADRGSHNLDILALACAELCKRCEEDCETFEGDEHMERCAEACRNCYEVCNAETGGKARGAEELRSGHEGTLRGRQKRGFVSRLRGSKPILSRRR